MTSASGIASLRVISALCLLRLTSAILADGAQLTPKVGLFDFAHKPLITAAPTRHKVDLRLRQVPIATCGYFDGAQSDPYTCGSGQGCLTNDNGHYFGCCVTDISGNPISASCTQIYTPYQSCYDYNQADYCTGTCYTYNRVW
jgi:hypothetical protein